MAITDQREIAETVFRHNLKRDEINGILKQEHARRETAVKIVSLANVAFA